MSLLFLHEKVIQQYEEHYLLQKAMMEIQYKEMLRQQFYPVYIIYFDVLIAMDKLSNV